MWCALPLLHVMYRRPLGYVALCVQLLESTCNVVMDKFVMLVHNEKKSQVW